MKDQIAATPAAGPAQAEGRRAALVRIGMFAPQGLLEQGPETARAFLMQAEKEGIDHVCEDAFEAAHDQLAARVDALAPNVAKAS